MLFVDQLKFLTFTSQLIIPNIMTVGNKPSMLEFRCRDEVVD